MSNSNYDIVKILLEYGYSDSYSLSKLPMDKEERAKFMYYLAKKGKRAAAAVRNSVVAKATKVM